jgi:hypothetical protein
MGGIARVKAPSGLGRKTILSLTFVTLISLVVFSISGNVSSVPSPSLSTTPTEEQVGAQSAFRKTSGEMDNRQAVTSRLPLLVSEHPDKMPRPICKTSLGACVRPYFPKPLEAKCPDKLNADLDVSSSGAWVISENFVYNFDQRLADAILTFVSGDVLELGAGLGCYSHYFRDSRKLSRVVSVEGAANVAELTGDLVSQADLTQDHNFGHFDWAITLEVAEHIPKQFEDTYIRNIISTSPKGIIISWAVPNQPGTGHVNGQTNQYVIELMNRHGYDFDQSKTTYLREQAQLGWFKHTSMVFTRRAATI